MPEPRFGIIGQTQSGRILHVVFAVREGKTRVISALNAFLFEWDKGNQTKSKTKHDVDTMEAQQVFVDGNKVPLGIQVEPIVPEPRFGIIGQTESGRILHVVFAVRGGKTRVISARTAHKKERLFYEKTLREER